MRNNTKAPSLARKGRLTDAKLLLNHHDLRLCRHVRVRGADFSAPASKSQADVLQ